MMAPVDAVQFIHRFRPGVKIQWNGNWAIHPCIIDDFEPHHSHGDRNASAGLNVKTGRYNCFVYSDHSISFEELCGIVGVDYSFQPDEVIPDDFDEEIRKRLSPDEEKPKFDLSIYPEFHHPYLTKTRGLSDEVLDQAGIRYDQYSGRIVIPIMDGGEVIAVQRRVISTPSVDGRRYQKYENSKNFDKSEHIYHIEELDEDRPLLVVESVMSVLKAWDYGYRNCCALFGSRLSRDQAELLKGFRCVMLDLDGDESGVHGTKGALERLSNPRMYVLDTVPYGSKDLADIGKDEFEKLMLHPMTPFEWLMKYGKLY